MNFKIGDRVKVINTGCTFTTYDEWIKSYAPDYLNRWHPWTHPDDIYKNNSMKNDFIVVAIGPHEDGRNLCLIQAYNGNVYLIEESGIARLRYNIKPSDYVEISDNQYVYTEYKEWLVQHHPVYLDKWKQDALLDTSKEYVVVAKYPKANFEPLNKTYLYLVQCLFENAQVYIMDEMGLFKTWERTHVIRT
ncbi:MAG: hypothetical protein ACI37Z_05095 [Candidatus Gastranaerophilaceae bacterium]